MTDSCLANAIRVLSMDAVQAAKSGHPGAPMGMAEMAVALWHRHLKHNPANPDWINHDRFVLSNGHGSMLLYSLLHLSGYDLSLDELKNFRQLHSKTPGHPETGYTPGVETTTGPLGQGITNAVGMALAEFQLAQEFNTPEHQVVDHFTYAFIGDGCMMEGISHESCSLAGTLRLSKLIALYDDNGISIDGDVERWFTDKTAERFASYDWHVIDDVDGHNIDAVDDAITTAKAQSYMPDGKPTLIICKTIIGHGAPNKAGGHDVHGAPLGEDEIAASKEQMGWSATPFHVPDSVRKAWLRVDLGQSREDQWQQEFEAYAKANPDLAEELLRRSRSELPKNFKQISSAAISVAANSTATLATRKASQLALNALGNSLPELFGGSADLTGSNLTLFDGAEVAGRDQRGQHLSYGVREFAMAAIMNGMALHGCFIPYGGTFLTFSDYSRNAIRMAALMKIRLVHVFTHDSIGLGEDGPTHQSVEHVPSLRIIPNLDTWRPADELETMISWVESLKRMDGPSALVLSRQSCPSVADSAHIDLIAKGAYILSDRPNAVAIIIATGSEVSIAMQAQEYLEAQSVVTRVVSVPCTNRFDRCDDGYKQTVIPQHLPIVAVEAAQTDGWHKYVGRQGAIVGIDQFGESAPAPDLYRHFGITANAVAQAVLKLIA